MSLPAGARLGSHEILQRLGAGGMGEVYRAYDHDLGRDVAIKLLPEHTARDADKLRRFEQEARAASALNHPNIVTIYEFGRSESTSYIVMELVDGKSLRELVAAGPLSLRRLLPIAAQTADGLAKAHAAGIVHRDLKLENLMVSNDGFVKILDFGLAKLASSAVAEEGSCLATVASGGTPEGILLGTIGYMSPEQAAGRPVDFRSDQFSLGSVLYELASGRRAFERPTAVETLAAIIREGPEPLGTLSPALPAPLCWIVERCLAKEPEERYASTHDLARDLTALRERLLGAPPAARGSRPAKLPVQRTRFVGRDPELSALRGLLRQPEVRLITLTGPGGIGKTRLGLQVAQEASDEFPGGVCFVPLAPVREADGVAAAIARALELSERGGEPPLERLRQRLGSLVAPMLLLLDNFEHVVAEALVVAELVAVGRHLRVLVTSRSPLHVYGEQEFPVPPLALPLAKDAATAEALSECESVSLFLQRATAVKPDFALTRENAAAIARICARLDGLPLAIELAAARVKLLAPAAMLSRLERRLPLLTGGSRDLPERQQTLRGAFGWSYELLNPAEQKLFRRLAVFFGGSSLEAVEAVCDSGGDLELDPLEGVGSMMDKSLLRPVEPPGGETRYVMLETLREYALERLVESGEEEGVRRAHAAYCLVLAEEMGRDESGELGGWMERFELEQDNFRAALDWLAARAEVEWGLRLGAALFRFWEAREQITEGRDRLTTFLTLPGAQRRTAARARALLAAGVLATVQHDHAAATALAAESRTIHHELGNPWGAAVSLNALVVMAFDRGDLASARSLSEENLRLWRDLGDRAAVARSLSNLASVVVVQRDFELAQSLYAEALAIFRELEDPTAAARVVNKQGDVARAQGNAESAQSLYEDSLATFRRFADRWGIAGALADLGNLARDRSDYATARSLYRESLRMFEELGHQRGVARLLECFACTEAQQGRPGLALKLAGAAAATRHAIGTPLGPVEQAELENELARAREVLTDSAGAEAWMEGWGTPVESAVATALAGRAP